MDPKAIGLYVRRMPGGSGNTTILREGVNCWRIASASRASFLIDTASYYRTLHECLRQARRSILIAGWEIDPLVELLVDEETDGAPSALGPLLAQVLAEQPSLEVHVLRWDYAPLGLGRLFRPFARDGWPDEERFRIHVDRAHAPGASHHQKLVVVDDDVAFCGGMDLTWRRWDTPEHRADDVRRTDRQGNRYNPWHDTQLAVSGEAAAALGELVRERWARATGEEIGPPDGSSGAAPWPRGLEVDLKNTPVAVSRTMAAFDDYPAVQEIEALYQDAIHSATDFIYIENQYLTSQSVGTALAERLMERDGPEIVIITPTQCAGWLEEGLMSALRVRLLNRLVESDRYNRLRTYCPVVANLGSAHIDVHSKAMVIDDRFVTLGSANISNRSMNLDTEANLSIEASPGARARRRAIADFRNRLAAEHLGATPERVAATLEETGSLIRTIDLLADGDRALEPMSSEYPDWIESVAPSSSLSDPERPVDSDQLIEAMIPRRAADLSNHPLLKAAAVGVVLAGIALWKYWPREDDAAGPW